MKTWKDIPYHDKYEASIYGEIRDKKTGEKISSFTRGDDKHQLVNLIHETECITLGVHRIIAMTFIPNPNMYPVVHHIDDDPENNKASNLKWVTQQQNVWFQKRNAVNFTVYHHGKVKYKFNTKKSLREFLNVSKKQADLIISSSHDNQISYSVLENIMNKIRFENSLSVAYRGGKAKKGRGKLQQWIGKLSDDEIKRLKYDLGSRKLKPKEFEFKYLHTKKQVRDYFKNVK